MPSAAEAGLGDGGEAALLALSQLLLWFEIFAAPVWPFSSCPFDQHNPSPLKSSRLDVSSRAGGDFKHTNTGAFCKLHSDFQGCRTAQLLQSWEVPVAPQIFPPPFSLLLTESVCLPAPRSPRQTSDPSLCLSQSQLSTLRLPFPVFCSSAQQSCPDFPPPALPE